MRQTLHNYLDLAGRALMHPKISHTAAFAFILILGVTQSLVAQDATALVALSIPRSAALRCHARKTDTSAPIGVQRFQFQLGGDDWRGQREIEVIYDSAGIPLSLLEAITRTSTDGLAVVEGIVVAFDSHRVASGFHTRDERVASQMTASRRKGRTSLPFSAEESRKAATLAEWLWARRCGKSEGAHGKAGVGSSG